MFLPRGSAAAGGRWADHRMVINGVFFRARAGCPWRDLPESFGNWKTVYNRHRRWSLDGTWEKILDGLRAGCDEAEGGTGRSARTPPSPGPISMRPEPAAPGPLMTPRGARMTRNRAGRPSAGPGAG